MVESPNGRSCDEPDSDLQGLRKDVILWTGAGQIGMAIARRIGYGRKIVVGDKNLENAKAVAEIMNEAGFDVIPVE